MEVNGVEVLPCERKSSAKWKGTMYVMCRRKPPGIATNALPSIGVLFLHDISGAVKDEVDILELEGKNLTILGIYPVTLGVNRVEVLPCGRKSSVRWKGTMYIMSMIMQEERKPPGIATNALPSIGVSVIFA